MTVVRSNRAGSDDRVVPRQRRLMAVMASLALVFGFSVISVPAAVAAPGDPVVFADVNLENEINDNLAQPHGSVITEAQAASITNLNASNAGITDLGGIQHLVNLDTLHLNHNNIVNVSPLSGLTSLTWMNLSANSISNVSPLSSLTNLNVLYIGTNDISNISAFAPLSSLTILGLDYNDVQDISVVSGMPNLFTLFLNNNHVSDVSHLSGLANLTNLYVDHQTVTVPSAAVGANSTNPVVNVNGAAISISSGDAGFTFNPGPNSWSFASTGPKSMAWNTNVSVGSVSAAEFSGTISQEITAAPIAVTPVAPEVIQGFCDGSEVVSPEIILPTTEGIVYEIDGEVAAGETVTITASVIEGYALELAGDSDWVLGEEGVTASLEIVLDAVNCDEAPAIDDEDGDESDDAAGDDALEKTDVSQSMAPFGVLLLLAGTAIVAIRRRVSTN